MTTTVSLLQAESQELHLLPFLLANLKSFSHRITGWLSLEETTGARLFDWVQFSLSISIAPTISFCFGPAVQTNLKDLKRQS